ncbi:MAG: hypothetical protein ABR964_15055 [Tepidisphaeraceae bacterium]|jgi:hypothetical protein
MSTATPSSPPTSYAAPRRPLIARFNWRVAVFCSVVGLIFGSLMYLWADEFFSGGIHDRGGFKEVNLKAMSSFDMDQTNATPADIPVKFRALEGQKVLMIGEMYAPQEAGEGKLSYFVLVYSKTKCCFNGPPLAQHFVDANVMQGAAVYYYDTPVKVWGKLHVYIRKDPGGVIKSIYHVDVEKVEPIEG